MIKNARSMRLPWIAAMAFFMQSLDATILNTALPSIAHSLERSPLVMQSVIVSYMLTVAMLIPISGWLADRFGTRKVFILAVTLFSLGSLFCAFSTSLFMLVGSRILQGIGGAMMVPTARLAILRTYPRSELLSVISFVTIPGLIGPILGPLLGGWMVTYASWHWIFLINLPIGVASIFYARHHMPNITSPKNPFDYIGFLLFSFSLVCISIGVEFLGEKTFSKKYFISFFSGGIILLLLYVFYAKYKLQPLFKLSLFKMRTFSIGILGNLASRLGTGSIPFLIPLMLQVGFGYSAILSGCMMAPIAIGAIAAKLMVTNLLKKWGYRTTLVSMTFIIGVMIALFSLQNPQGSLWLFVLPLFLLGMAISTQFTTMNTITLSMLDDENASSGNSFFAVTQQLSIGFGVAVSASILNGYNALPFGSLVDHFHYTFMTMGGMTMLSAIIFLFLHRTDGDVLIKNRQPNKARH